ncbi:MAG: glycosyltransferase [Candidatus Krumholzibacteria bacterium]|nr:glycosyltransferase [Candidatus Krumholzibacteria bacterium]MDP6796357.1 glycosyltransferase [Candidatus Krumholzibacteria bacterium]MDP7020849.1 glycosyltransferase [Candidatus Krumholzibacteria bacterium]
MLQSRDLLFLASTLEVGGGEKVLAQLLRGLRSRGLSPKILTLKEPGPIGEVLRGEGTDLVSWGLRDTRNPLILFRLLALIRRLSPRLIYIQDHDDCIFWGSLAVAISGFRPILIPVHSPSEAGYTSFRRMSRPLLGLGQSKVLLGPWHQMTLRYGDGIPESRDFLIANPLTDPGKGKREIRGDRDELILGTLCAFREQKRLDRMLELFREFRHLQNSRLSLYGEGPELERTRHYALELGISEWVDFRGSTRQVRKAMAGLDVFLMTSEAEAQPLSLVEALAEGTRVAAVPKGEVPSILDGGRRGLLFTGDDPADWARQLHHWLSEDWTAEHRQRCSEEILREFSPERFLDEYHQCLLGLGDSG